MSGGNVFSPSSITISNLPSRLRLIFVTETKTESGFWQFQDAEVQITCACTNKRRFLEGVARKGLETKFMVQVPLSVVPPSVLQLQDWQLRSPHHFRSSVKIRLFAKNCDVVCLV